MRKIWLRILILILIFALAAAGLFFVMGRREETEQNTEEEMGEATLPVLSSVWNGISLNELHGYLTEMDAAYMRDTIMPLSFGRTLSVVVDGYGDSVLSAKALLYSLDGTRFLEEQDLSIQKTEDGRQELVYSPGILMEEQTEYRLLIRISTEKHENIYYYTRLIQATETDLDGLLQFAFDFSDATFDKKSATEMIIPYIAPDDTTDNSSFADVSLNSTYEMITWGSSGMQRSGDLSMRLTEISPTQISVTLTCMLEAEDEEGILRNFETEENFCVRKREDKMYLISYDRQTEQVFDPDTSFEGNSVLFGVASADDVDFLQDSSGRWTAFVFQNGLWLSDEETRESRRIFSFREEGEQDARNDYDQNEIRIVSLNDQGELTFMVVGYMNRGKHEGTTGTCLYRYEPETETTEELYYIPADVSYQILKEMVGEISYVNDDGLCYFLYGTSLYSVDLDGAECMEVIGNVRPDSCTVNADGNVLMFLISGEDAKRDQICVFDMDTGSRTDITADEGEYEIAFGFLQNDLVYGVGKVADIVSEAGVETTFPLYRVRILNSKSLKEEAVYQIDGIYVTEAEIEPNRIVFSRMQKKDGKWEAVGDDALLLNEEIAEEKISLRKKTDDKLKLLYSMELFDAAKGEITAEIVPSLFVQEKESVEIPVDFISGEEDGQYYVYAKGGVSGIYGDLRTAIENAYDDMGVVLSADMQTCWNRDTRDLEKTISMPDYKTVSRSETLGSSLCLMLEEAGASTAQVEELLAEGKSPVEILEEASGETVADLYGCTVYEVLYYLNLGQPVLAVTGEESAVVLVGYTTNSLLICDPSSSKLTEWTQEFAEKYFANTGNCFAVICGN